MRVRERSPRSTHSLTLSLAGNVYTAALGYADMATNRNSYYKLQLLEHDNQLVFHLLLFSRSIHSEWKIGKVWCIFSSLYYLFRSWGRMGTEVGGNQTDSHRSVFAAVDSFEA